MARRRIEIEDKKYVIWLASEFGTDTTDFEKYITEEIKNGKTRGSYPHWEVEKINNKKLIDYLAEQK
jgi:hypothetical protein